MACPPTGVQRSRNAPVSGHMNVLAVPRLFLYSNDLSPEAGERLTAEALKRCDDGELYLQYTASEAFGFDDLRLKTADFNTHAGFGLRGVSGEDRKSVV